MINGSIQEDITIVNIYAPNTGSPQCKRQMLTTIKGKTDNCTILLGDFKTSCTVTEIFIRKKINKETQALNDTLEQVDLTDIYRTFHHKTSNIRFSQKHMEHSLG